MRMFLFLNRLSADLKLPKMAQNMTTIRCLKIEKQYDASQVSQFGDKCALIDENDRVIGTETKRNCHLIENIDKGMLHRAFSVFMFDTNNRLLLQQRSLKKITYPNHWTNSCCSHPLDTEDELDAAHEHIGIKRAAKRRLVHELGIEPSKLNPNSIEYITRIHYKADNVPLDGTFAEHEIDYVLFVRGDYELNLNPDEVKAVKYLTRYQLQELLAQEKDTNSGVLLTPWFKLICEKFLFNWWDNLNNLKSIKDHTTIHRFV